MSFALFIGEAVPYVLAFIGFSLLIILHEFGHFSVAKATGMRVERFALFFPPLLVKTRRGETEYGIGAIPAGGFVKITGMNPEEKLPPEVAPRAYYAQPVWKRIVVIGAGPAVNVVIAFALLFGLAFGETRPSTTVDEVVSAPAKGALQPGDRLVSVDGRRGDLLELRRQISSHRCRGRQVDGCSATIPAVLGVVRDGRAIEVRVRPRYDEEAKRTLVGFTFGTRPLDPSLAEAVKEAGDDMWLVATGTVEAVVRVFDPNRRDEVSGVVGAYEVTRQAFEFDTRRALIVLAVISLSLATINLFPFLPLDGGHIFWSLVEKLRGRPVPFRVMEQTGVIGFMLVAFIFVVGVTNDFGRLTGEGFQTR